MEGFIACGSKIVIDMYISFSLNPPGPLWERGSAHANETISDVEAGFVVFGCGVFF